MTGTTYIETRDDATTGLTKDTIQLMRKATRIVFLAFPDTERADGQPEIKHVMRIIRETTAKVKGGPEARVELWHDVTVNGAFDARTYDYLKTQDKVYRYASAHLYLYDKGIRSNDDIQTWLSFLKPGDVLTPTFYPDAYMNGYMQGAKTDTVDYEGQALHCDVFRCHIKRAPKTDKYNQTTWDTFSFALALSICPANSARMCRETPYA